jgi:subtilisin
MPEKKQNLRRYIIMNSESDLSGAGDPAAALAGFKPSANLVAVAARPEAAIAAPQMRVLDQLHENGAKLVEMPAEGELSLRLSVPGLKIVPEVFYHRQWERFKIHQRLAKPKAKTRKTAKKAAKKANARMAVAQAAVAAPGITVSITDASGGAAIKGAQIIAFTDFASRQGASATTGANGSAVLTGIAANTQLERVYIYAPAGYWGFFAANTTGAKIAKIKFSKIDVRDTSLLLTQLYGSLPTNAGDGVTVGIIDSGVDGKHPDLTNVSGGLNCVGDETRNDPAAAQNWGPAASEGEHGTHVAGIVGGRGTASGFRGVAPGVALRSYRVFPNAGGGASNFDIAKAIDTAVADKCDIINMSLGGGPKDDLTHAAIDRALNAGVVVVVAAGNDNRQPVAFPAAFSECVAVSAMGRIGSFSKNAIGTGSIAAPKGNPLTNDFIADFSNVGTEIDTTGAGVEIVSTLPGTGHGSMSGTSMASPAVAGFAAFLLAKDPTLKQKVGAVRSRALKDALYASCKPEKFGRDFEGFGLPTA